MVIITLLATWVNKKLADAYLITLPISYITFAVIAIFLIFQDDNDVEFSKKVELIEDGGKALKWY